MSSTPSHAALSETSYGKSRIRLVRVTRRGDDAFEEEDLGGVVFVPLLGEHGWPER